MNTSLWVPILDRRLLADGLQRSIDEQFEGRLAAAAEKIEIQRLTLRRLVRQECGKVKKQTFLGIMKLLPVGSPSEGAFIRPAHVQAMRSYADWSIVSASQIVQGNPVVNMYAGHLKGKAALVRADDVEVLIKRVRDEARRVATELCRGLRPARVKSPARYLFLQLTRTSEEPRGEYLAGIAPERYLLAFYRIIQPLLDSQSVGQIERHYSELALNSGEFQQFIEAGWLREKILLRREGDRVRPQRPEATLARRLTHALEQEARIRRRQRARVENPSRIAAATQP